MAELYILLSCHRSRWEEKMAALSIENVLRRRVVKGGHATAVDVLVTDGKEMTLECRHEILPLVVTAFNEAGVVAERVRMSGPGTTVSTEVPYYVTDVSCGASIDSSFVIFRYKTSAGPPMIVAIPPAIARRSAELALAELGKLGNIPPLKSS
jgi:hypothetical protein